MEPNFINPSSCIMTESNMNIIYQLGLPRTIFIYTTTNRLQSWQGMKELFLYLVCYLSAVYYIRNGWGFFLSCELCP